jgi:hypothetical protein
MRCNVLAVQTRCNLRVVQTRLCVLEVQMRFSLLAVQTRCNAVAVRTRFTPARLVQLRISCQRVFITTRPTFEWSFFFLVDVPIPHTRRSLKRQVPRARPQSSHSLHHFFSSPKAHVSRAGKRFRGVNPERQKQQATPKKPSRV